MRHSNYHQFMLHRGRILWVSTVIVFWGAAFLALHTHTPAFRDRYGRMLPTSIASLEEINVGAAEQWVLIRGRDIRNPVLLFLHGGPGMPTMFLAHEFQRELEENFIVVQWDRRGAGKSYNGSIPPESMSVEQEIADTRAVTNLLRERFHQNKIYLVGFSYGSYLGMLVVKRYPDLFHAYIGIGQEACSPAREHEIQDAWIRQQAVARSDGEALEQLKSSKPLDRERWLFKYGAEIHNKTNWHTLLWAGFTAPEYNLFDIWKLKKGVAFTAHTLKFNTIDGALMDEVTAVDVPVYFFSGRFDYTDPVPCTIEYFDRLRAPKKQLVWFDNAAHFVFLDEPQRFSEQMRYVTQSQ